MRNFKYLFSIVVAAILLGCNCEKKEPLTREFLPSAKLYSMNTPMVDITYGVANDSTELKLDLYLASKKMGGPKEYIKHYEDKRPTLIFIHGGAWYSGDKSTSIFEVLPYIENGWQVVNINYRLAKGKKSIADCLDDVNMALAWVKDNADKYHFDMNKIVIAGDSAGGHLALMLGAANTSGVKVASIVNWYGVTNVQKCLDTWKSRSFVNDLIEDVDNYEKVCRELSPVTHISEEMAPVITIHGTKDETVPYSQGVELHEKLEQLGIPNLLYTVEGKKHGDFDANDMALITQTTFDFLKKQGLE